MKNYNFCQGFGLIETLVAMGIMIVIAVTGAVTVLHSLSTNRLGDEETEATLFAQEGIEAVRSIKNQGWNDPFLATDCSSGCGIDAVSGYWKFFGTSNSKGKFSRQLVVSDVYRNDSGEIVESGGILDPDTKKITSIVSWNFNPGRNDNVSVITYLTNWRKAIGETGKIVLSFGLQAGQGGITMYSNAEVEGEEGTDANLYSNGVVQGYGNSKINGNVWAVDGINPDRGDIEITKNAYGSIIQYCQVKGDTYSPVLPRRCRVSGSKNIAPAPTPMPLPQIDLDFWHSAAQSGGTITGDYNLGGNDQVSLGPKVITGDVHLDSNAQLTVTGTLWIHGTFTMESNSQVILDDAFGENGTIILLDHPTDKTNQGKLLTNSNAIVNKTSQNGYILFVSTNQSSDCSVKAADVSSKAKALAILASDGCVQLNSNAKLTALAAKQLVLNSNSEVSYDSTLSSITYVPTP